MDIYVQIPQKVQLFESYTHGVFDESDGCMIGKSVYVQH